MRYIRLGICAKYFLLFHHKKLSAEKTETNYVFAFLFLNCKISVIQKKCDLALRNLASFWQSWCFCQFIIQKLKDDLILSLSQFFLVGGVFEKMRENILHIAHIILKLWNQHLYRCFTYAFVCFSGLLNYLIYLRLRRE